MSNPFQITEPTVISFSGGRTSAFMLYKVLEAHHMSLPPEAKVIFCNTGKEHEATLDFVRGSRANLDPPVGSGSDAGAAGNSQGTRPEKPV